MSVGEDRKPSAQERIDRACYRLLTDPELRALVGWWETEALRSRLPAGPPDQGRLLMAQGDRERLLSVMERAGRHQAVMKATGEMT
jgi:hypothetical protein